MFIERLENKQTNHQDNYGGRNSPSVSNTKLYCFCYCVLDYLNVYVGQCFWFIEHCICNMLHVVIYMY